MFKNIQYIYKQIYNFNKNLIVLQIIEIVCRVIAPFCAMLLPAFVIYLLEEGKSIEVVIASIVGSFIVYGIFSAGKDFLQQSSKFRYIEFRISTLVPEFFGKCISLDYDQFEEEDVRKKIANSYNAVMESNAGTEGMIHAITAIFENALGILLYMVIVANIHPWLILLFVVTSGLQFGVYQVVSIYMMKAWERKSEYSVTKQYMNGQANNVVAGKDIRLFQLAEWLSKKYKFSILGAEKIERKTRYRYFANDIFGLGMQLIRDIVCYVYLFQMFQDGMAASTFVVMIGAIAGFSIWFTGLANAILEMIGCNLYVKVFREFLDIPNARTNTEQIPSCKSGYKIQLEHVSFVYPNAKEAVLKDINFTIEPNEKIALVGMNGAGKSTLIKLLCGFYKPTSGTIYINDVDITTIDTSSLQKNISAIFQDTFIPHFTILENVLCEEGKTFDKEQVYQALKEAGILEKIQSLEKQEHTYIGTEMDEAGIDLSGGERQKLSFARAIYRPAHLLLLDEPTAALDPMAEKNLYEQYGTISTGRTSIFISHRLASTRFCDKILLMNDGIIGEQGTHEELVELKGCYYEMYEAQRRNYVREMKNQEFERGMMV